MRLRGYHGLGVMQPHSTTRSIHRRVSMGPKTRRISRAARLPYPVGLAMVFATAFAARPAGAALPASGTITPSGGPITWIGTATGGASESETTCVEGTNCDTFTLTVSGAPADWAGLVIPVQINW